MERIEDLVKFISEDAPFGDVTTEAIIPDISCVARIQAKQDGIIAGLAEAEALFSHFGVTVRGYAPDGDLVHSGQVLMELSGNASADRPRSHRTYERDCHPYACIHRHRQGG